MKRSPVLPFLVGCLTAIFLNGGAPGAAAQPTAPTPVAAAPAQAAPAKLSPEELKQREPWRKSMLAIPLPKKGCFTALYPEKVWREIPCRPPTPHPPTFPHSGGMTQPDTVGGTGPDFSATVTGHISTAEGSFDSATGITSTNAYSLQLNTQQFSTTACSGSPNNTGSLTTGCRGWEQFVYESNGTAFIQYWLLDYGPSGTVCPAPVHASCGGFVFSDGWCPFTITLEASNPNFVHCAINAANEPPVSAVSMPSIGQLKVAGATSGTGDSITVTNSGTPSPATGDNRLPGLDTNWNEAEFNAFGGGNSAQTTFNTGTNVVVRTEVLSGSNAGPGCDMRSFTGESTNLTLGNTPPASPAPMPAPALVFSESNPPPAGPVASCLDAVSIGDTHLQTFNGLLYDFQAAGDFLLADTGRDFQVQTRQVSGAPTWPNADVNSAVGVQVGHSRVAFCIPERVLVDGEPATVTERKRLVLPGGGWVSRLGNVYTVWSPAGDSLRAEMDGSYINVSVGLGKWPSTVRGLLANANGNVGEIQTRAGSVLTANLTPDGALMRGTFAFDDLYHPYADSWRIPARDSLLAPCGGESKSGIADRVFYARDLAPELAQRARTVCTTAGVKEGPLLDACTLDVAVIGDNAAANVYVGARAPVAVGLIVGGGGGLSHLLKSPWCCALAIILLLIGSILLAVLGPSRTGPLNLVKWLVVMVGWIVALYCLIMQIWGP